METLIFKFFGTLFRLVGILILSGTIATVLGDLQKNAIKNHKIGLTRMLAINHQLVGKK